VCSSYLFFFPQSPPHERIQSRTQSIVNRPGNFFSFTNTARNSAKDTIVEEDPDDDKLIECAVALKADFIISPAKALIAIQDYMGIRIVTPKAFFDNYI
jgi:predicted nucleic acid-binding protein